MSVDVTSEFYEYGKKMKLVAIFTIIPFLNIVAYCILWSSLTDLLSANSKISNTSLENYHSKFSTALIFRFVGFGLSIANMIFPAYTISPIYFTFIFNPIGASIQGIGLLIALIGGIIEMGAWQSFLDFIDQSNLFPGHIHAEVAEGAKNLKTAAILHSIGFLVVTGFISWILSIVGYFKLACLETITYRQAKPSTPAPSPGPVTQPEGPVKQFCSTCGAEVQGAGKFCGECGSQI